MAKLTGNEFLVDAVRMTLERTVRMPSKNMYLQYRKEPHAKHKLIVESLKSRDVEKVNFLLRDECRRDDDINLYF
jgi:DNA-binding GntR family transcriptional regulator